MTLNLDSKIDYSNLNIQKYNSRILKELLEQNGIRTYKDLVSYTMPGIALEIIKYLETKCENQSIYPTINCMVSWIDSIVHNESNLGFIEEADLYSGLKIEYKNNNLNLLRCLVERKGKIEHYTEERLKNVKNALKFIDEETLNRDSFKVEDLLKIIDNIEELQELNQYKKLVEENETFIKRLFEDKIYEQVISRIQSTKEKIIKRVFNNPNESIYNLGLPPKIYNALKVRSKIKTIGDLLNATYGEISNIRGVGKDSMKDIEECLLIAGYQYSSRSDNAKIEKNGQNNYREEESNDSMNQVGFLEQLSNNTNDNQDFAKLKLQLMNDIVGANNIEELFAIIIDTYDAYSNAAINNARNNLPKSQVIVRTPKKNQY